MKNTFFLLLFIFILRLSGVAQYWQQQVAYTIDVTLNDKENTLDGFEKVIYTNHSPDTLTYIWFHIWPNAYKNDKTRFSDQLLENGSTAFYFSTKEQKGYINRLDFKVNGSPAKTEDHPQYIDVIKVNLPMPLLPAQQITISTPFHVKLPYNFSRGGYDGKTYQVTQWYPKPAVYDAQGWHPMPYLDQGEFYSEYGSYNVSITVPKTYVVAATGQLQNEEERAWIKGRKQPVDSSKLTVKKIIHTPAPPKKTIGKNQNTTLQTPDAVITKTLQYKQDSVHDFAWFADKNFIVQSDTCQLASGKIIDLYTYYTQKYQSTWKNSVQYAKDAVRFYSGEVGEYPYSIVSAVQGPQSFGGGMEYPTITLISPTASAKELDITLTHEIGHNWFYGILGSNERVHPWMDEGINSFYEYKYAKAKYGEDNALQEILFQTKAARKTDQPIETSSDDFSASNYALVAYHKTAKWLQWVEQKYGAGVFKAAMQQYYTQWKFRHPQPKNLEEIFQQQTKTDVSREFNLLHTKGLLPDQQQSGWRVITPFTIKPLPVYLAQPNKNTLLLSPLIGANNYDKLMIGGVVTNYKFPPSNFQFLAIPFYATGSKKFTGLGKLNYTFYPDNLIRKWDVFINAATFSMDKFTDSTGKNIYLSFKKLVPGFRITFNEKNARSTTRQYIQWKTYLLNEGSLKFGTDTAFNGRDTLLAQRIRVQKNPSYINQLKWVFENYRALYPFDITVQIEQGKEFAKSTLTANYFFNYGVDGGLKVRFFAGKFFYLNGKTTARQFNTDRYQLNLTGPNGYEDYTYTDYFMGRNNFDGFTSQQIMIRDGAFKVRTDLLAGKVGKTDDWLMAANFNSTIPNNINPLSVLPIKIPLHLFLDIGTYAEAWKGNATADHFLFDAGLRLPLFNEIINLYVPLFYSSVYSDYFKSTISKNRFLKTISFSIKLNNTLFKKVNNELEF